MQLLEVSVPEGAFDFSYSEFPSPNAAHKLTVTFCDGAYSHYVPIPEVPWGGLVQQLILFHQERQSKDGPALICGALSGGRKDANMLSVSALAYDIDGKMTLEELDRLLEESGYEAVAWTTHNHGRTVNNIGVGSFRKWQGSDAEPTDETMQKFCAASPKHAHLTNVRLLDDGAVKSIRERGRQIECYKVAHDPEHKLRIVFPLSYPIPLKHSPIGIPEFKAIYRAHGQQVFADRYDGACANPARLHFLPSHPPGATDFGFYHYPGRLVVWDDIWGPLEAEILSQREEADRKRQQWTSIGVDNLEHSLKSIPPDIHYTEWFGALAAIFHATGGSDEGNALAHAWSEGDPRYDFEQVERIWDSLDPNHPKPATFRTLVRLARKYDASFKETGKLQFLNRVHNYRIMD